MRQIDSATKAAELAARPAGLPESMPAPGTVIGWVSGRPVLAVAGGAQSTSDDDSDDDQDDDDQDDDQDDGDDQDDKKLGPKGERALAAEKEKRRKAVAARRAADREVRRLEEENRRLKAGRSRKDTKTSGRTTRSSRDDDDRDDDEDRDDIDDRRRDRDDELEARVNRRVLRSEVKALAAKTFADPTDALRFLDLEDYEVDEDGEVDTDTIRDDLQALLKERPYLAAAKERRRFGGGGDGGARDTSSKADADPGRGRLRNAYTESAKKARRNT